MATAWLLGLCCLLAAWIGPAPAARATPLVSVYAAGTGVGGADPISAVAAVEGGGTVAMRVPLPGVVASMVAVDGVGLVAGGVLDVAAGAPAPYLAVWPPDGRDWVAGAGPPTLPDAVVVLVPGAAPAEVVVVTTTQVALWDTGRGTLTPLADAEGRGALGVATALTVPGAGVLVVGGGFEPLMPAVPCVRLCVWNGTHWQNDRGGFSEEVTALVHYPPLGSSGGGDDDGLVVAGAFRTLPNGTPCTGMAVGPVRLPGNVSVAGDGAGRAYPWTPVPWPGDQTVLTMAVYQGDLYAGGNYQKRLYRWTPATRAWLPVVGADLLPSEINALLPWAGVLWVGGNGSEPNPRHALRDDAGSQRAAYPFVALMEHDDSGGGNGTSTWTLVEGVRGPVRALALACATNAAGSDCTACFPGYFGPDCLPCMPVCASPRGVCFDGRDGNCTCATGWAGTLCDTCDVGFYSADCLPCSACEPAYGVCVPGLGGQCTCRAGRTGPTCAACVPDHYGEVGGGDCLPCTSCVAQGVCYAGAGGNCTCNDPSAWTGPACDICTADHYGPTCAPCGACVGICYPGLSGNCTCAPGTVGPPACAACAAGLYGPDCAYACAVCAMHGTCIEGRGGGCNCTSPAWTGPECAKCVPGLDPAVRCPCTTQLDCNMHGRCVGDECVCLFGYAGDFCETPTGCRVEGMTCQNGGNCTSPDGTSAVCVCPDGFEPTTCAYYMYPPVSTLVAEIVTLPLAVVIFATVTAQLATWVGHRFGHGGAETTAVYVVVFTLFSFATDIVFVALAWLQPAQGVTLTIAIVATTSLALNATVNLVVGGVFLYEMLQTLAKEDEGWRRHPPNAVVMVVVWLASAMNVEVLRLLYGRVFGLSWFCMPVGTDTRVLTYRLQQRSWVTNVLEHVPQLGIQLYLLSAAPATGISIMAAIASTLALVFTFAARAWAAVLGDRVPDVAFAAAPPAPPSQPVPPASAAQAKDSAGEEGTAAHDMGEKDSLLAAPLPM
jgi:hypothetical protein